MENSVVALTFALQAIEQTVLTGFGLIQADVFSVYNTMLGLSLVAALIFWIMEGAFQHTASLIQKFMMFAMVAALLQSWQTLTEAVFNTVIDVGLSAGGSTMSVDAFRDPGAIAKMGLDATAPLRKQMQGLLGWDLVWYIPELFIYLVTFVVILFGFIILAWQVFFTVLGFLILSLAVFFCVPFAVLNKTSFIAERAMGYVVGVAIRLLVLALVVSVISAVLLQFQWSEEPSVGEAIGVLTIAGAGFILAWWAPNEAAGLVNGGPVLDTRGAFTTLWTAARVSASAVSTASGLGRSGWNQAGKLASRISGSGGGSGPRGSLPPPSGGGGGPTSGGGGSAGQRFAAGLAAHRALPRP